MIEITLVASSEEMHSAALAAGVRVKPGGKAFEPCPLSVGDFIGYPSAQGLTYRVKWRMYVQEGPDGSAPEWMVGIEPAQNPLA